MTITSDNLLETINIDYQTVDTTIIQKCLLPNNIFNSFCVLNLNYMFYSMFFLYTLKCSYVRNMNIT